MLVEGARDGTAVPAEEVITLGGAAFSRSVSAAGDANGEGRAYGSSPLKYSSISPSSPEQLCGRGREDELSTERKAIKSTLGIVRERDTLLTGVLSSINLVQESGEFFVRGIPIQHSTHDLMLVQPSEGAAAKGQSSPQRRQDSHMRSCHHIEAPWYVMAASSPLLFICGFVYLCILLR